MVKAVHLQRMSLCLSEKLLTRSPETGCCEGRLYSAGQGHRLEKECGVGSVGVCRREGKKDGLTIV